MALFPPRQAAAADVLRSQDLMGCIWVYQHGLYASIRGLHRSLRPFRRWTASSSIDDAAMHSLDAVLGPYYANKDDSVARLLACDSSLRHAIASDAVFFGRIDVMAAHSLDDDDLRTAALVDLAARGGHVSMVSFLHDQGHPGCTTAALDMAAARNHFEVVAFLTTHRSEGATAAAMDDAAACGHLHMVQYLHMHRTEGCTTRAMDAAATNGHLDVVHFLHDHRAEGCTTLAMDNAAHRGHVDVVHFLHTHRHEGCTTDALDGAAAGGHLDMVRFLHFHRVEGCTTAAFDSALLNDHGDVVRFLATHRREGPTAAMRPLVADQNLYRAMEASLAEQRRHASGGLKS
ncbi:Aste57867_12098 [Aphanomyces stellatus]|uniref:Aste57867_12098 protein n=1 Tax=Aphanomyces stellatus TaxID=120398 RepID=A0A485KUQ1_9STRA|nr:hypothetical protein As57867_012053 [Aphanomyces stellatus]VFT88953.1 Aste57867_12098 [Aphanomyces stellatus]